MNNNLTGFSINKDILNCVSNIMYKLGKISITSNNKDLVLTIKKINPYDKNEFFKLQNIRQINVDSNYNFKYPNYKEITKMINQLFNWLDVSKEKIHPLIYSIIFLYSLIFIHPFDDKNDHYILLWFKILLIDFNDEFYNINFEDDLFTNEKGIIIINDSFKNNSLNEFIIYILKIIDQKVTQDSYVLDDESIKLNRLLSVMEAQKPMSAFDIMEKLNIKSKETFRNSYIDIAINKGLVFRTIPNKPTSRNQMYYKK